MKRPWLSFTVALLLTVATAIGVGWLGNARNRLPPSQWVNAREKVVAGGSEFTLTDFGSIKATGKQAQNLPLGAIVVAAVIDQQVITAPTDSADLVCQIELVSGNDSWPNNSVLAHDLGYWSGCSSTADFEPLAAGQHNKITAVWVTPPAVMEQQELQIIVSLANLSTAFGVHIRL